MTKNATRKRKSLFRRAFANQYNFILMAAAGVFALATFSWVPIIIGAGIEGLWLTFGSDLPFFRRWVEKQEREEDRQRIEEEARAALAGLEPSYRVRFEALSVHAEKIRELAGSNASLEAALIETEMEKLGQVLHSFLRMAVLHQRLGTFLRHSDEDDLIREMNRLEKELQREKNLEVKQGLRESISLADKRIKQHAKILASYKVLSLKMDTLEKSMSYLESQIVGMAKSGELTNEIDEIVMGVEAVDEISAETEGLLGASDRSRLAQASQVRTAK
jgi:hypothetical protein